MMSASATTGDQYPVSNWPVYLWTDGVQGPQVLTVSGGCYTWTGLIPGRDYAVQEHVYSTWIALTDTYVDLGIPFEPVSFIFINTEEEPPPPPPFVPEASTLLLLGSAVSGLAGYIGLQVRSRRRKQ